MIKLNEYEVLFKDNLNDLESEINQLTKTTKLFIVTDIIVYNLYYKTLTNVLSNYELKFFIIENKSLVSYEKLINELLVNSFSKTDLLVAFGGGVVGDLTGFVAATLYRGVNYIQIPTTLLAQLDSSVGSKTGIDTSFGKNLIGSFYNPKLVYIAHNLLNTLSDEEYNNGFAEAIKMTLLFDEAMFHEIKHLKYLTSNQIKTIVAMKVKIVEEDPLDLNVRNLLNFGHTFGHAIEKTNNYQTFKHGQAISHGMVLALELGNRLNLTSLELTNEVEAVLHAKGLLNIPIKDYQEYLVDLKFDKKHNEFGLNFIILTKIGKPKIIIYKGE